MNKNKLSSFQFAFLFCFPILSLYSEISFYNIIMLVGVDCYLSYIIAYILGFSLLFLFFFIFQYEPDKNILEKNVYLFGKIIGTCINIIMNIFIFFIGIMIFYSISNFIVFHFINQISLFLFMIILGVILIFNINKGMVNMARVAVILLIIFGILSFICILGLFPSFKLLNLKPFLEVGVDKVFFGGIEMFFVNNVSLFLLLIIKKNDVEGWDKIKKRAILLYTIAFLFIIIDSILTIGVIGIYLTRLYQYPLYIALENISLFNFIDRIENFVYIKWFLVSFVFLSLIIYHISKLLSCVRIKYSSSSIVLMMIVLSFVIFKNNTNYYNICYYIFPYICIGLVAIYIIIGINIFIRRIIG